LISLRRIRAWGYRQLPVWSRALFLKKLAGFERCWNLEEEGFTKQGLIRILQAKKKFLSLPGLLVEAPVGDGRVGSLGAWLESENSGWKVEAWEHRPVVLKQLQRNRPCTEIHQGRLIHWEKVGGNSDFKAVTTRGAREAAGLCQALRKKKIKPQWMGIWNPTQRPVWYRRMKREGYRLEFVWHNMEFYGRTKP